MVKPKLLDVVKNDVRARHYSLPMRPNGCDLALLKRFTFQWGKEESC
jgi:hypothetical protein